MAETPSQMIPLKTKAPAFSLLDVCTGKFLTLADIKSDKATVIMFICNHCPYVIHIQTQLLALIKKYQQQDIAFVAICSNDAENYPADAPDKMQIHAKKHGFTFPYLHDETQEVAKAYHAACTPDFFVFDKNLECVYRGRFDGATPGNNYPVTGEDLSAALDNVLSGAEVKEEQKASLGCNIKWKS